MSPPDVGREGSAADEFVRESFRDIKRTLEIIQKQLSFLPQHYVSRAEFDRYRDEMVIDLAGGFKQHEKDIAAVQKRIDDMGSVQKEIRNDAETMREKAEEHAREARNMRLILAGLVLTAVLGLPTWFSNVAHLFH